ncbi:MAG: hypothetical protein KBS53_01975 [Bacteroidales bacterium]|nr:hypothetical protein [Candidatus Hennigimonas equi]
MKGNPVPDWEPVDNTYFNKQAFLAIDPFNGKCKIPSGPRLYVGFIFYH